MAVGIYGSEQDVQSTGDMDSLGNSSGESSYQGRWAVGVEVVQVASGREQDVQDTGYGSVVLFRELPYPENAS